MSNLIFSNLVDIEQIRELLEAHFKITGIGAAILDTDENIMVAVGYHDICTRFHLIHPIAKLKCRESDAYIKAHLSECNDGFLDYRCKNGLVDVAVPIIIRGEHLATFFTGQFFYDDDKPDVKFFRKQAEKFGFDETGYLEVLGRVPVLTRDRIHNIVQYYRNLVKIIAGMGLKNLELCREAAERMRTESVITARLRLLQFAATHTLDELLEATLDEAEKLTGSLIGFYHFLEADQKTLSLQNWSTRTKSEFCTAEGKGRHYDVSAAGIWAECIHESRPVIHNDYASLPHRKGMPPSHASVVRELVVPVFRGESIVAILGVGNKPRDYTPQDVETVSLLADLAWEIAERKRWEEALLFSRFCIDKAAIGIFQTDENGTIFSVNDYACASLGYSKDELCALSVFDIDPDITHEKMLEIKKMLDEKGLATHETTHRRRDGTTFPVEITANLLEFQGETLGISFVKDITERKRAEEARWASEVEKSLILNSTMDYVVYHDPDMKIVWANWKAGKLANLPVEKLTGRHCWEVLHGSDKPCAGCPVVLARDTGEPQKMEMRHFNGLILSMHAHPIKDSQGRLLGIVEHVIDITEQKRANEALQKAHGELESRVRERTEQLTSLAAELSLAEERERRRIATELHDQVGQSLILSKIKLDSLSCSLPSESFGKLVGEIREYINQSIEEIRSLTFQLSPPLLYEVGFEAAVEWIGEEFEGKYGFKVEFKDDGKTKPLHEETSVALYQMVRELLVNIAKHAKAKRVRISVERVADEIKVTVADDGSGFDSSNGMRHKNKKRGFGLFSIRQRIEYMGGELAIESKNEQGTRVTLRIPLENKKSTNRKTL